MALWGGVFIMIYELEYILLLLTWVPLMTKLFRRVGFTSDLADLQSSSVTKSTS
jgi:hypothetical protein